jgi:hypothetical protein
MSSTFLFDQYQRDFDGHYSAVVSFLCFTFKSSLLTKQPNPRTIKRITAGKKRTNKSLAVEGNVAADGKRAAMS